MIITRKDRVLKDLYHKITNNLIDKVYKQTLRIELHEQKLFIITKLYNNNNNNIQLYHIA